MKGQLKDSYENSNCKYEVRSDNKVTDAVTLSPILADHASIPHIEAMSLPFHVKYSSPIWCNKLVQKLSLKVTNF